MLFALDSSNSVINRLLRIKRVRYILKQDGSNNSYITAIPAADNNGFPDQETLKTLLSEMAVAKVFQGFSRTKSQFSVGKYAGGMYIIFQMTHFHGMHCVS